MKKLLTTILLFASLAASACWFTEANFNATYIAGVNNFFAHYCYSFYEGDCRNFPSETQIACFPMTPKPWDITPRPWCIPELPKLPKE